MLISTKTRSYLDSKFRPLRVFPGDHIQRREIRIFHFTDVEAAASIKKTGQIWPGAGQRGVGVYLTIMHPDLGFSKDELKLAIRSTNLPDAKIAMIVEIDTDDLDRLGLKYLKIGNTIFIKTDEPINIKSFAKYESNWLVDE